MTRIMGHSGRLGRQLDKDSRLAKPVGADPEYQVHHIVPMADHHRRLATTRRHLLELGVDLESKDAGAYLPVHARNAVAGDLRVPHNATRWREYARDVQRAFADVEAKEQAEPILREIQSEPLNPPQRPRHLRTTLQRLNRP